MKVGEHMIIEAVFNAIVTILLGIIKIFPTIPEIKTDGLDSVFQFLTIADTFISLGTFVACMTVIFILKHAELFWSAIMWVVRKIPNVN